MYLRAYPLKDEQFRNKLSVRKFPKYELKLKENNYNSTIMEGGTKKFLKTPFSNSVYHNTSATNSQVFLTNREKMASPKIQLNVKPSGSENNTEEVRVLEERIQELENKNSCLRNKCKQIRTEKIKTLRLCNRNAAKWRCEKKDLTEINNKLMKMMEKVKSKLAYVKQGYE